MHLSAHDQQRIKTLLATAQHEVLSLVPSWRPPLRSALQRPRTRTRVVVSRSSHVQAVLRPSTLDIRLGEDMTMFLLVIDRRRGVIRHGFGPLGPLLVRPTELASLISTFEERWENSFPIAPISAQPSDLQLDILRRLATGMTDQATAKALKISPRTVQRQVSNVMEQLGARSRLELGLYLAAGELL